MIAGSSRLKAGTAQKMVLNMISTATMVRLGYVTGNRMSNVQTRNVKLRERAIRILMAETGLDQPAATAALETSGGDLSLALVMSKTGQSVAAAQQALVASNNVVSKAIEAIQKREH